VPIQIDHERAGALATRFDEAIDLVVNEFTGLDPAPRSIDAATTNSAAAINAMPVRASAAGGARLMPATIDAKINQ
jgi:hypothetical protein